jgi:hypothetical protein
MPGQNPALQLAALKKAGCQTVFKDEGLSLAVVRRRRKLEMLQMRLHLDRVSQTWE